MKKKRSRVLIANGIICSAFVSCAPMHNEARQIPSLEYARTLGGGARDDVRRARAMASPPGAAIGAAPALTSRAAIRQVSDHGQDAARFRYAADGGVAAGSDTITNVEPELAEPDFQVHENAHPDTRDYNGPLSLGDPGVSASLWQESRGETNLFHDFRAWQPMDLITINVIERSEGTKQADTDVSTESTFQTALQNFFGYENDIVEHNSDSEGNPKIDLANIINASATSEFKGEGETRRTDNLRAQISAIVVEVLPGGLLRIEGERIISMNNEEQIMIISGLARTRDINSDNQIDSAKIANLRIDYFGRGVLGDAQYGGWLGNLLRLLWPF